MSNSMQNITILAVIAVGLFAYIKLKDFNISDVATDTAAGIIKAPFQAIDKVIPISTKTKIDAQQAAIIETTAQLSGCYDSAGFNIGTTEQIIDYFNEKNYNVVDLKNWRDYWVNQCPMQKVAIFSFVSHITAANPNLMFGSSDNIIF